MIIAWDTETHLISSGNLAPKLVCVSACGEDEDPELFLAEEGAHLIASALASGDTLVGHNISYDAAVMMNHDPEFVDLFFRAYDENRIEDTMIREKLLMIAQGKYKGWLDFSANDGKPTWKRPLFALDFVARRRCGMVLTNKKEEDAWRKRYSELDGVPLSQWPAEAAEYAKNDAVATMRVFKAQRIDEEILPDRHFQVRNNFWLHLTSCRGLITNPKAVLKFKQATEAELEETKERLIEAGLVRKNGTRDTKAAKDYMVKVCNEAGMDVRYTDTGNVALDSDACEATDDPVLIDYANFTGLASVLNKDIPMLVAGVSKPIHTRYGLAESGRTTSSSDKKILGSGSGNFQNFRRGAKQRKGESKADWLARKEESGEIRECFVPRIGHTFIQADYPALELRTLAEVCYELFGYSKLGDDLNAGNDPHSRVASVILGKSYEWVLANKESDPEVDNARQTGKVANFGFPGGLGAKKLVLFARKSYRVNISEDEARNLKYLWLSTFPEMEDFFDFVNRQGDTVQQLYSNRYRGGCTYCAACNTLFQGLGADASQRAGWLITKACFSDKSSPLYGSRPANYIHDEFHVETLLGPGAHDAAMEVSRLMMVGANEYLPHVPYKPGEIKPLLMQRWSKSAKPVYDENKRLVPWK